MDTQGKGWQTPQNPTHKRKNGDGQRKEKTEQAQEKGTKRDVRRPDKGMELGRRNKGRNHRSNKGGTKQNREGND